MNSINATMPAIAPPMMGPLLDDVVPVDGTAVALVVDEEVVLEFEDSVLVVTVVEEVSEETGFVADEVVCEAEVTGAVDVLVCKTVLVLNGADVGELDVLDSDNQFKPSSRQIPKVQGSVAQQPRKFPAEQTYHCFEPSHVVESRPINASMLEGSSASGM